MLCGYSAKLKIRKDKNENKGDQGVSSIMSLGKEQSKTGKGKAAFSKKIRKRKLSKDHLPGQTRWFWEKKAPRIES